MRKHNKKQVTGQSSNEALSYVVKDKELNRNSPDPHNFLEVEGIVRVNRRVRWSEEIDKTLYGKES